MHEYMHSNIIIFLLQLFKDIQSSGHGQVTVFFCGSPVLARVLSSKCDALDSNSKKKTFKLQQFNVLVKAFTVLFCVSPVFIFKIFESPPFVETPPLAQNNEKLTRKFAVSSEGVNEDVT